MSGPGRFSSFGAGWLLAIVLVLVLLGPLLSPYSPTRFDATVVLQPPSWVHWFGTDEFGRDVLSRLLHGARPTLVVALFGAAIGVGLGTVTGIVAGYFGGWVDEVLMRMMDVLMSYPGLILAMLLIVVLGPAPPNVVAALVVVFWPRSTRLCRAVAMEVSRREFIDAARVRGERHLYIMLFEVLPNLRDVVAIDLSLRITSGILMTASLAYLGMGNVPPSPAWGLMIRDGQQFVQLAPWLVLFPCLAVALAAVAATWFTTRLSKRRAASLVEMLN